MHLVIVSGRSGAGKSAALGALEDAHFYCIDNLPVGLLQQAVDTLKHGASNRNLAVSIDVRTLGKTADLPQLLTQMSDQVDRFDVVFVDAMDETLARRFGETRRLHPLSSGPERHDLSVALAYEREHLGPLYTLATCRIDTSGLSIHQLREQVRAQITEAGDRRLLLKLQSFGFKRGLPIDSDVVFDARALPNPHWEPTLRRFTGLDAPIADYLKAFPETHELLNEIKSHLRVWIPRHVLTGRQYMTVSVGCTGGQHRSVFLINQLAEELNDLAVDRQVMHRELSSSA